jgi:hypothetical protein
MSKLNINLSYKNACILKHALRDKIKDKESWVQANSDGVETCESERKELEEEKRALEAITEEINKKIRR